MSDDDAFAISPEIDEAISEALTAWYSYGRTRGSKEHALARKAQHDLRVAIRDALAATEEKP